MPDFMSANCSFEIYSSIIIITRIIIIEEKTYWKRNPRYFMCIIICLKPKVASMNCAGMHATEQIINNNIQNAMHIFGIA